MEINCIICSDLFTQQSQMVVNQCGHMFHHSCLLQWLERSKTCPQCRCKTTEKSMYKVFFNFVNTEHITDNIGTLQFKLENANFRIQLLNRDLKETTELADSKEAQNVQLKEMVSDLEKKIRTYQSAINGLKDKLDTVKIRASEVDKLKTEISVLKSTLQNAEKVQTAIHGTRAEVTEILRNETNIEALALLSATLKKSLIDKEHKTNLLQNKLKHTQNELMKYKRDFNNLEASSADTRKEFEMFKKSWEEEKKCLKQKIKELNTLSEEQKGGTPQKMNNSVQRILAESPVPLPSRRRLDLMKCDNGEVKGSPTLAEHVLNILESDSPYLNSKTNYSSIFKARFTDSLNQKKSMLKQPSASTSKTKDCSTESVYNGLGKRVRETQSIFKQPSASSSKPKDCSTETIYTGLGGQVKEDYFKFPEKKPSLGKGLKRVQSSSAISASKFRKLAPLTSKKITDFTN